LLINKALQLIYALMHRYVRTICINKALSTRLAVLKAWGKPSGVLALLLGASALRSVAEDGVLPRAITVFGSCPEVDRFVIG
jgi:hypothetical protein